METGELISQIHHDKVEVFKKKNRFRGFWKKSDRDIAVLCWLPKSRGVSVMYQLRPSEPTSAGEKQVNNANGKEKRKDESCSVRLVSKRPKKKLVKHAPVGPCDLLIFLWPPSHCSCC
jgi:hypothetical protein